MRKDRPFGRPLSSSASRQDNHPQDIAELGWTRAQAEAVLADAAVLHPEQHDDLFAAVGTGEMFRGRYRRDVYLCALVAHDECDVIPGSHPIDPYGLVHRTLMLYGVHRVERDLVRLLSLAVSDGAVDRSHRGVEAAQELARLDGADRLRRLLVSAASSLEAGIDPDAVADRLRRSA